LGEDRLFGLKKLSNDEELFQILVISPGLIANQAIWAEFSTQTPLRPSCWLSLGQIPFILPSLMKTKNK
jgi:hypothetical protein